MYWILAIFAGVCLVIIVLTVPETYSPTLLVQKAQNLRKDTGEQRWYAPCESRSLHTLRQGTDCSIPTVERKDQAWQSRIQNILFKPFVMLGKLLRLSFHVSMSLLYFAAFEPMLAALTIYMSFIYGVIYLLFEAYPFVFIYNHGFNTGEEGLAFLGVFFGGLTAVILYVAVVRSFGIRSSSTIC